MYVGPDGRLVQRAGAGLRKNLGELEAEEGPDETGDPLDRMTTRVPSSACRLSSAALRPEKSLVSKVEKLAADIVSQRSSLINLSRPGG